jgi:hypothetical protein
VRRLALAVLIMSSLASSAAAQHDLSVWRRSTSAGTATLYPWYFYNGKVNIDTRYNFDVDDTAALCLGKSLGGKRFSFIPQACGYLGELDGWGPEFYLLGSWGKISFFQQFQYVEDFRSQAEGDASFFYHWTDLLVEVHPRVQLGADAQFYARNLRGGYLRTDVGPAMRLNWRGWYAKCWVAWSVGTDDKGLRTTFLAVGKAW